MHKTGRSWRDIWGGNTCFGALMQRAPKCRQIAYILKGCARVIGAWGAELEPKVSSNSAQPVDQHLERTLGLGIGVHGGVGQALHELQVAGFGGHPISQKSRVVFG